MTARHHLNAGVCLSSILIGLTWPSDGVAAERSKSGTSIFTAPGAATQPVAPGRKTRTFRRRQGGSMNRGGGGQFAPGGGFGVDCEDNICTCRGHRDCDNMDRAGVCKQKKKCSYDHWLVWNCWCYSVPKKK